MIQATYILHEDFTHVLHWLIFYNIFCHKLHRLAKFFSFFLSNFLFYKSYNFTKRILLYRNCATLNMSCNIKRNHHLQGIMGKLARKTKLPLKITVYTIWWRIRQSMSFNVIIRRPTSHLLQCFQNFYINYEITQFDKKDNYLLWQNCFETMIKQGQSVEDDAFNPCNHGDKRLIMTSLSIMRLFNSATSICITHH